MLLLNIFDGIFDRHDLDNLLSLDPATEVCAHLRPWGWPSTFTATITGLPVEISLRPSWAAGGYVSLALTDQIRHGMRAELDRIPTPRIWLHAEPISVALQPSSD